MADLTFVQNDTAPSIYGSLTINGVVVNLTGAQGVNFQMRLQVDRRFTVDAAATIVNRPTGEVRYDWVAGDLAYPGDYIGRWQITFGDGSVQHSDGGNTITVSPE